MKLTKLHVENFGALKDFDLTPTPGLNRLEYPNGWGKSTLAAFLKAMLFGLPSARGTEEKNDRKKYTPWQGGLFGGSVELSSELGSFRIERSFGMRPMQDRLSVIDLSTGRPTDRLGEIPGETLFGIDADGFDKSVYYTRRDFPEDKAGNASVTARLNSLLDNVEDAGSFEYALDEIKSARRDLENPRGGEKIAALENQLFDTKRAIARLEEKREDLAELEDRLVICNDSLAALETAEEEFRRRKESYTLLQKRKKLLEEEAHIQASLSEFENAFCGQPLSKEELDERTEQLGKLQSAITRARTLEEAFPKDEYDRLTKEELPSEDALDQAETLAKERRARSEKLAALKSKAPAKKKISAKTFFITSACLLPAGIGSAIPAFLFGKYLLLIATALLLLASGLFLLLGRGKKKSQEKEETAERLLTKQIALSDEAFGRLSPAFSGHPAEEDFVRSLRQKKERLSDLDLEKERLDSAWETAKELSLPMERFSAIYEIHADQKNPSATISRLKDALAGVEWNRRLLAAKKAERAELEATIGEIPKDADTLFLSAQEIDWKAKRAAWDAERKRLEPEIKTLSDDIDRIPELSDWLTAAEADLASRKEKLAVLEKTEAYIKAAKDALSTRYRTGIERLLPSYLKRAGASLPEGSVDPDLQVSYYKGGRSRPLSAFSQGERDLTDFCLRLSLTEALSAGGETPFLLLDDPFVNLDDDRHEAAKKLLLDLANDYQIFYLVCRKEAE